MQDKPCAHFSIEVRSVPLPGSTQPVRLPHYRCALKETLVEALEAGMPPLIFGPDGKLVCRQGCNAERHQTYCQPAIDGAVQDFASESVAGSSMHPALQEARSLRERSRQIRQWATQERKRAFAARQKASVLLQQSTDLLSRYTYCLEAAA